MEGPLDHAGAETDGLSEALDGGDLELGARRALAPRHTLLNRVVLESFWQTHLARDDEARGRRVLLWWTDRAALTTATAEAVSAGLQAGLDLLHPHSIPPLAHGTAGRFVWFTTRCDPGRTLGSVANETGGLDPAKGARVARQVASFLALLHRRGLVHGALCPSAVMIEPRGRMRVRGFGVEAPILCLRIAEYGDTREAGVYAAPEVLAGESPTELSDQYSLARILGDSIRVGPDDAAFEVLARALEPDPSRRHRDIVSLHTALMRAWERYGDTGERDVAGQPGSGHAVAPPDHASGLAPALDRAAAVTLATTADEVQEPAVLVPVSPTDGDDDDPATLPHPPSRSFARGATTTALWIGGLMGAFMAGQSLAASGTFHDVAHTLHAATATITASAGSLAAHITGSTAAAPATPGPAATRPATAGPAVSTPGRPSAPPERRSQQAHADRPAPRRSPASPAHNSRGATPAPTSTIALVAPDRAAGASAAHASAHADDGRYAPGRLYLNAFPWGVVYVGGRRVGDTPLVALPLSPGTHTVRVERDGYQPYETRIDVPPGGDVRRTNIVLKKRRVS